MDGIPATFLLEAESLLQDGNARESAVLCTRGIMKYPMYKTAYIVLIRALNELGDIIQIQEVYDDAPNFVKFDKTVQYMMNNLESKAESVPDKVIEQEEGESITEIDDNKIKTEELETVDSEPETNVVESNVELESEITNALKNDELSPEVIEDLSKSEETSEENDDSGITSSELKETLTLAKIYEQQDAYEQALDIYLDLQTMSEDKELYADKIVELKAIIEEESS